MAGLNLWQSVKQKLSLSSKKKPQNDGFTAISADGLDEPDPHNPKAKFKGMRVKPQGKKKTEKKNPAGKVKKPSTFTEGSKGYYCAMNGITVAKLRPTHPDIKSKPHDLRQGMQETCSSISAPQLSLSDAIRIIRETDPATARDSTSMLAFDRESIEISTELSVSDDSDIEL
jgi:hypothetical protein